MRLSTTPSQSSTLPLGYMLSLKGTRSFWPLTIPVISIVSSVNCRLAIASKHFLRCGCTASGFFVCERICRSSSFERKKKRANASRFVSR